MMEDVEVGAHERLEIVSPSSWPSAAQDYYHGPLDLNALIARPASSFMMRVSGDGMRHAGLHSGDIVVVDRSITHRVGHVVVVSSQVHGLGVGRWVTHGGKAAIHMANGVRAIDPATRIFGVVTMVIRTMLNLNDDAVAADHRSDRPSQADSRS